MLLAWRNRALEARVVELRAALERADARPLAVGDLLPELELERLDGTRLALPESAGRTDAASRGTLLFVSSAACDACAEVRDTWEAVARAAARSNVACVELVLDGTPAATRPGRWSYPAALPVGDPWRFVRKLRAVPAALLIDPAGRVAFVVHGTPHDRLPDRLARFLSD